MTELPFAEFCYLRQHIAWPGEQNVSKLTNFLRNVRASLGSWRQLTLDLAAHQAENTHLLHWCAAGSGQGEGRLG